MFCFHLFLFCFHLLGLHFLVVDQRVHWRWSSRLRLLRFADLDWSRSVSSDPDSSPPKKTDSSKQTFSREQKKTKHFIIILLTINMQQCSRRVPSFLPSYLRKELSTEQKLAYHFQTLLNSITEKNSHLLGLNLMEFPTFFFLFIFSLFLQISFLMDPMRISKCFSRQC